MKPTDFFPKAKYALEQALAYYVHEKHVEQVELCAEFDAGDHSFLNNRAELADFVNHLANDEDDVFDILCRLQNSGDYDTALKEIRSLDTIVRETIDEIAKNDAWMKQMVFK